MHGTLRTHIIIFADVCLDGTQCRQGSLDAPDATRYGAWVQDAQDAHDAQCYGVANTVGFRAI